MDDLITRCSQQTLQAGCIKMFHTYIFDVFDVSISFSQTQYVYVKYIWIIIFVSSITSYILQ